MSPRSRVDSKKSRVYAAEQQVCRLFDSAESHNVRTVQVHGSTLTLPVERKFGSVESVQRYVDAVLALNWVRERYAAATTPVAVRARRGQALAHYDALPPTIAIPLRESNRAWALREMVVLHEIAHHLAPNGVSHGRQFVDCFIELVTEIIGPEAGLVLRSAMYENAAV